MTPREENEALAIWAGIECRCHPQYIGTWAESAYWKDCPRHSNGGIPPDYDRDEVAQTLLNVLVSKGYYPTLGWVGDAHFNILEPGWMMLIDNHLEVLRPTIAAAIKAACKKLLEIESGGIGEVDAAGN